MWQVEGGEQHQQVPAHAGPGHSEAEQRGQEAARQLQRLQVNQVERPFCCT